MRVEQKSRCDCKLEDFNGPIVENGFHVESNKDGLSMTYTVNLSDRLGEIK